MKKLICFFALIVFLNFPSSAQKEKDSIEISISRFFDGLSEINPEKIRSQSTDDFLLLEEGEVWNMDTLIAKVSMRKNMNIVRTNSFEFIKTEQAGNMAWVSYHNTAVFKLNEKQQTVRWLESAVLVKEKGKWKIRMMHSTRMK
jgi:hypothetical protein